MATGNSLLHFAVGVAMPPGGQEPPRATFASPFAIGDRVMLVHDESDALSMTVTALSMRTEMPQIEVTWTNAGALQTAWLSPALLRLAPRPPEKPAPLKASNVGVAASCELKAQGLPYPRLCPRCGLGPCFSKP
ncbi:hypothetical protein [Methylobacterium isbiliense]|uniref:Uncharacterized protein n=1 Tax=Methylobacterium isbiliense TaxID=315478 RepID=A0ABQ4SBP4_9HYPH|nr:hypothetical protein [Methylobacterium isbiliense]MDN3622582.1 hypothetical protein [Methylobacterium isbiliense]GJE00570.1 hypothetical protein GMJLKIPL_2493 [Methylobacterium isbiliense]